MSDPVTNAEIEDVLSSIRRLVADGEKQGESTQNTLGTEATGPDGPLVLTPSLRIGHEGEDTGGDSFTIARRVARLEAAVTVQEDEFEPDGSEAEPMLDWPAQSDDAPTFQSRERVMQARAETDITGNTTQPANDDTIGDMDADEPSLDEIFGTSGMPSEELLRDLVAEVLRDELAGALGERITRNIRKLVRREIHRVLDSREIE